MRVRINQPWQQPALGHQISPGDRISGPPVTGGVQVSNILPRQRDTPDSDDWHQVVHWTEFSRGGHFAAMEAPGLLVGDVRTFFRQFR